MVHPSRLLLVALVLGVVATGVRADLAKVKLPPGFHIEVYAVVPGARSLAVAEPLPPVAHT